MSLYSECLEEEGYSWILVTRVLQAMRRTGRPDRPPFEISWGAFTPSLMKVYQRETGSTATPDEYFDFDTRSVDLNPTRKKTDFSRFFPGSKFKGDCPDFRVNENGTVPLAPNAVFDEWGCGSVPGSFEHFVEFKFHPLQACKTPEEIVAFPWPDLTADYRYEGLSDRVAEYHRRGYAVNGELYQTIFEQAWLCGHGATLDRLPRRARDGPCDLPLHRRTANRPGEEIGRVGRGRAPPGRRCLHAKGSDDELECLSDLSQGTDAGDHPAAKQVKPDVLIFMHCDGRVGDFVEELIDIGVDILNPVQPECNDLESLAKRFQGRISFWGGIGTQSVMPFGTPAEVAAEVRRIKTILGPDGGLLLAPTHILEPDVPWENVLSSSRPRRNVSMDKSLDGWC